MLDKDHSNGNENRKNNKNDSIEESFLLYACIFIFRILDMRRFTMFFTILFNLMPYPKHLTFLFGVGYIAFYHQCKSKAIEYHESRLSKLDSSFKISEAGHKLVKLREEAIRNGVGPMDPEYPDLSDVLD